MNVISRLTIKNLWQNKARTLITIIGIILSGAMITAVATLFGSFQQFMIKEIISSYGNWHGQLARIPYSQAEPLRQDSRIAQLSIVRQYTYAENFHEGILSGYTSIVAFDDGAFQNFPIALTEGRMPQNSHEIIIPKDLYIHTDINYTLNGNVTLTTGHRLSPDGELWGNTMGMVWDAEAGDYVDRFVPTETKTYTIVGLYTKTAYANLYFPGILAFTTLDESQLTGDTVVDVYALMQNPRNIFQDFPKIYAESGAQEMAYQTNLLRLMGIESRDNFMLAFYIIASVLILVIMIGSISLIYNAFDISVSERLRQFGMLSSMGATKEQIRHAVLFESLVLAIIGIPLGILSGILGIGVTLKLIEPYTASMLNSDLELTLIVSHMSVLVAAAFSLITILLSAWIPAAKASRTTAIDAIRLSKEIKLTGKSVKTSRLSRRLFGFEGELALKNLKRNRKKYRATIFSLVISIILFNTVSAFTMYLNQASSGTSDDTGEDIRVSFSTEEPDLEDQVIHDIINLKDIDDYSFFVYLIGEYTVQEGLFNEQLFDNEICQVTILGVNQEKFETLFKSGEDMLTAYQNIQNPKAILLDTASYWNGDILTYTNVLSDKIGLPLEITLQNSLMGDKEPTAISIGYATQNWIMGAPKQSGQNTLLLFTTIDTARELARQTGIIPYTVVAMQSGNSFSLEQAIREKLDAGKKQIDHYYIYNLAERARGMRSVVIVISVFTYGFIALISLITLANIINTITTNIRLRRREFAMLKSVGMTPKGFNRMVAYESIIYGLYSLVIGIPISVALCYMMYIPLTGAIAGATNVLPLGSMIGSAGGILVLISLIMFYSVKKVNQENLIDGLKHE